MSHIDSADTLSSACEGTWVRSTEYHETTASTNDRALEVSGGKQILPRLIYARAQTAGRGRGKNVWWATEGALTFSLLLDPTELGFSANRWASLSLATAMAVGRTLLERVPTADVTWKWPNDVFVGTRKICGILLEVPSTRPARMVIGVGLNVNNQVDEIAQQEVSLRATAVSLSSLVGDSVSLTAMLRSLLGNLEDVIGELRKDPFVLARLWQARDFLQGRQVTLSMGAEIVTGVAVGIDSTGALLIEVAPDTIKAFPGGVITEY